MSLTKVTYSMINGASVNVKDFGAVGDGVADDTAAIQTAFNSLTPYNVLEIPKGVYRLTSTILTTLTRKTVFAYAAQFVADFDGIMFNLNSAADPSNIEPTSISFGNWKGGTFYSGLVTPLNTTAIQAFGCRQLCIEDCIFGISSSVKINNAITIAGLGAYRFINNRFLLCDIAFNCPAWATNPLDFSGPITTSYWGSNQFTLTTNQKAFYVNGGWNRWTIQSGFVNGSGAPVFHFTNNRDASMLNILNVGFEQAVAGGKFLYIEDTGGNTVSVINVIGCGFNGDPSGGGHSAIEFEKVIAANISGNRIEGNIATGNYSVKADANCSDIIIEQSNRIPDAGVDIAAPRRLYRVGNPRQNFAIVLSGFNGNSKSSSTVTLDMSTLLGADFPKQAPPLSYDLLIQCRDSGSATSTSAGIEVYPTGELSPTARSFVDLRGVPNDERVGVNVLARADSNGDIDLKFFASGVDTLDVWVFVLAVNN